MTTIATDGVTIAADGLSTFGDEWHQDDAVKIIREGDVLFAFAGSIFLFNPLIKWWLDGAKTENYPTASGDHKFQFLVFTPKGREIFFADAPYPDTFEVPFAVGSGADYARGAMEAGKSPTEAIQIASKLDMGTGGKIITEKVPAITHSKAAA